MAEANPNLVTVIISGGPCDLQEVVKSSKAMVQGWWNGIEGGTALAEVLFGDIAPSGKLPFTFPVKLEDSPAYAMGNFPNTDPTAGDLFTERYRQEMAGQPGNRGPRPSPESKYTEGYLVGYRWFDTKNVPVMYAFGHGLSYVNFEYGPMKVSSGKKAVKVTFDLTNTGSMPADEVVQLYVRRIGSKTEWPSKELKAFGRVSLGAGETKTVTLEIPTDNLRYWNVETNSWTLEHSNLELLLGSASNDIRQKADTKI